jgi:hypothetical protein
MSELISAALDREDLIILLDRYYPKSENTIPRDLYKMGFFNHDNGNWRWNPTIEISNAELYQWYLNFKTNNPFR